MSRKRERDEDDNHLHEPIKKAKLLKKDKKDKKEKKDKNKLSKNEASVESEGTQLFDITELVENILQYLILKPETVLSIARVSRRHNAIVHAKSFWTRLGFTTKLSKTDLIEPQALKRLLIGLRRSYIQKKYKSNMAILDTNNILTKPISQSVDLTFEDQMAIGSHINAFLSQRLFTSEAFILLERMRCNSNARNFLDLDEFLMMVLIPESKIEGREEICHSDYCYIEKYPALEEDTVTNGYYDLLLARDPDGSTDLFAIKKKFIDGNKSVVFLCNLKAITIHFISINEETNMIECCGDLILSALDPNNYPENKSFYTVDENVMYYISRFLSGWIFELDEVNENLAKEEFEAMQVDIELNLIQSLVHHSAEQYYWEYVPLYRK